MHNNCDHNFKKTQRLYLLLAWELNATKVTKNYSRCYPHLNDFTMKLYFRY